MTDLDIRERDYFASMAAAEAHGSEVAEAKRRAKAFAEAVAPHLKAIRDLADNAAVDVPFNVYRECIADEIDGIDGSVADIATYIIAGTEEGEPE